ncbi:MAG: EamA family transporter [Nocardioidaceae bacterium]
METNVQVKVLLMTTVAPVAWGSTYLVTQSWLPPDRPLFSATVRALPIGLLLLAARRELPRGDWWWKAAVLGACNISLFFALLFLGAYRLPGGLAATITAISPLLVMVLAWAALGERAPFARVAGGVVGIVGVGLLVLRNPGSVDLLGLAGALGAVLASAVGFVLVKRWPPPTDLLTVTSWQLVAGGILLVPVALVVEGAPPALDASAVGAYGYLGVVGTGLAYVCWFGGLGRLPAGSVSLIGLVNPVVGTRSWCVVHAGDF